MAEGFDSSDYLQARFGDLSRQRATYVLGQLHTALESYIAKQGACGDAKVLDFGCGPVVQNSISAAAFASEIVFCDIHPSNREAVQKWLDRDPEAFDWSPHFDYVVKTLEGKGEEEAREREERMRRVAKVAFCDALSEMPMEKGYQGPYNIILQCACLEGACSDKNSYKVCMERLISLLKPGGLVFNYAVEPAVESTELYYTVGDQAHPYISLSYESLESILKESGLLYVEGNFTPMSQEYDFGKTISQVVRGFHAISGVKPLL